MKRNAIHSVLLSLCPVAMAMTTACGGMGEPGDDTVALDDDVKPRLERVELTRLELSSNDTPAVLHPVQVEVELDVVGDAFDTDVLVGLTADDGELGCVLGALEAKQDEAGVSHLSMTSEFLVKGDCGALIGRDDVELFATFDPWGDLDYERDGVQVEQAEGLYDVMRYSMLGTDECDDCRVSTPLLESPGIDAQLREVNLGSSVAVLPVAAHANQQQMPADDRPQFAVSTSTRITGLGRGQAPRDGETYLTYRIRPLAGASGTGELEASAMGWAPLLERFEDEHGNPEYFEQTGIESKGGHALQHAAAVYIGDEVAARMSVGDWHRVNEFELQTCVGADFEQAVYPGESEARANDCAVLPVVVAREFVDAKGGKAVPAADVLAGGANARTAEVWGVNWSTSNNFAGTNYTNGIGFSTWVDLNASDSASQTYGGRTISGPATWFEAGANSTATVFNNNITLLDAYLTAVGYNSGAGSIEAKVEALGQSIIDTGYVASATGAQLTLEQILQASGLPTTTTWDAAYPLVGYSFDDGCGTVSAGIFLKGEIGLDNQASVITVSGGAGGMTVSGTIAPTAAILAESKAEAGYSGFVSINVGLTMAIDILRLTAPFTSAATVAVGNPNVLTINSGAALELSSLSGTIDFSFNYTYWCPNPFSGFSCSGNHSHNLASWSGPSQTWNLFSHTSQPYYFGGNGGAWGGLNTSGAVAANEEHRWATPVLPAGTYTFSTTGNNDADLYVRTGAAPTTGAWDCRPYSGGSNETCVVNLAAPNAIHVMVRGWASSSNYTLTGVTN